MRLANIRPIYPRRHLTQWKSNEYVHPYLLKGLDIERSNQVWEIDITYVPMARGFMYLTAIIDVYSRYIVGWGLSNSLDAESSPLRYSGVPLQNTASHKSSTAIRAASLPAGSMWNI